MKLKGVKVKMTARELIKKYDIRLDGDGKLSARGIPGLTAAQRDALRAEVVAHKAEIVEILEGEKKAAETARNERQAKIDAIEGLKEIEAAISAELAYAEAFDKMMDDEGNDGARPPKKPTTNPAELRAKYPRAAAYLKAEAWEYAAHYAKSAAGRKAKERIINGEDYTQALADMEAEWSAHCEEHIWD